jgi:hypothetical protein
MVSLNIHRRSQSLMRAERGFGPGGADKSASALAATVVGSIVVDMIAIVMDGVVLICLLIWLIADARWDCW